MEIKQKKKKRNKIKSFYQSDDIELHVSREFKEIEGFIG